MTSHIALLDDGEPDDPTARYAPPPRRRRRALLTYDQRDGMLVMAVGIALILAAALVL